MKKRIRAIALALVAVLLFSSTAYASTRASKQLTSYRVSPYYTSSGNITVSLSVVATNVMDEVGCSSLYVYEKIGSTWYLLASFNKNDTGMISYDSMHHGAAVSCDGYANGEFMVSATIFATDYSGNTDSRNITEYLYT